MDIKLFKKSLASRQGLLEQKNNKLVLSEGGRSIFTDELITAVSYLTKKVKNLPQMSKDLQAIISHIKTDIKPKSSEAIKHHKNILLTLDDIQSDIEEIKKGNTDALQYGFIESKQEEVIEDLIKLEAALKKENVDLESLPRFRR